MNPSLLGGHRNIVLRPRVAIAKTVSPPSLCLLLHREDIPRNRGSHLRAFGHSERLSPRGAVRRNELRPRAGVEHGGTEKFDLGLPRASRRMVQVWQRLRPGAPIDDFAKWRFVVVDPAVSFNPAWFLGSIPSAVRAPCAWPGVGLPAIGSSASS